MLKKYLFLSALGTALMLPLLSYGDEPGCLFPCPPKMAVSKDFWKKIYTEVSSGEGIIHDREHLNIVYEVYVTPQGGESYRRKKINSRVSYYQHQLAIPDKDVSEDAGGQGNTAKHEP